MATMVETVENTIIQEPEAEAQPGTAQPDDTAIETQLTQEISDLWGNHVRLSADCNATAKELRQIRATLAERLAAMKSLLSRPGRGGQWRSWLRERGIPRSTADRLASRHAETLGTADNVPTEAISDAGEDKVERLCAAMWPRLAKTLKDDSAVYAFICRLAAISEIGCELSDRGLLVLRPALDVAVAAMDMASPQPDSGSAGATAAPLPEPTAATPDAAPADAAAL
jgi:hypothetical protein